MEPPRKAPKLSLTEAAEIVNQQHPNLETDSVHQASSRDSVVAKDEAVKQKSTSAKEADDDDFSQEEEEENTQIQSSLPLYFDHMFGTCIGHSSQSQIHSSQFHRPVSSLQAVLPQCSFGFSLTDTRILDSQGFIFNSSTPSKAPVSAPPLPSSSSPTQQAAQLLPCHQPKSDPSSATVIKLSLSQSPAAIIFSSPSSSSSSPGTRSNCSGTPVLFPSPTSVHSHSPEKAIPKFRDTQIRRESLVTGDMPVTPSKVVSPPQQEAVKDGIFLSQALSRHLTCSQGSHSHQTTCRKRKLDFGAVTDCPADRGNRPSYVCPPTCTPLSDCTRVHSKVSMFAVVLQGKDLSSYIMMTTVDREISPVTWVAKI